MRLPPWLNGELDSAAVRILDGDTDRETAIGAIAEQIIGRDPALVRAIVRESAGKKVRERIKERLNVYYAAGAGSGEPGEQMELFACLPRLLEISPGRFAHLSTMTGPDWDAALRQAEVKSGNASRYAKEVRQAHEQVRPLLGDDGALTTADIAGKLAGGQW